MDNNSIREVILEGQDVLRKAYVEKKTKKRKVIIYVYDFDVKARSQ